VRLRWLGTACFVIETDETTVVVDPFVTRPSKRSVVFHPLVPDLLEIGRYFPRKVDAVVCGHSHYDHLLDGPALAAATGARFIGSPTSIHIARAAGVLEDQLVSVPAPPQSVRVGDVEIRLVPSLHGRFILRRFYLADGSLDRPPQLPARASTYKMGGAFGVFIRTPGLTVYHNGSADLVDAALDGIRADVLLVGLAGRQGTRDYLGRLVRALEPSVILPTHHDLFFSPLDDGLRLLPFIDLDGFVDESRRLAPKATLVLPNYHEAIVVPPRDPRGVGIAPGSRP
jgi:L-ascorbate metabolism protein UlaG (beta-lactamase superfamily)